MLHHPRKYAASFLSQDRRFKPQKEVRHAPHRAAPHRTAPHTPLLRSRRSEANMLTIATGSGLTTHSL